MAATPTMDRNKLTLHWIFKYIVVYTFFIWIFVYFCTSNVSQTYALFFAKAFALQYVSVIPCLSLYICI